MADVDRAVIEHLPKRLAVVSWAAPHAVPDVVRAADKMPPREGEVEYVRADLHAGAVEALRKLDGKVEPGWRQVVVTNALREQTP